MLHQVYVADDEPLNRKLLDRWLRKEQIEVQCGEDGADVVEQCISKGSKFDILLLDENMRVPCPAPPRPAPPRRLQRPSACPAAVLSPAAALAKQAAAACACERAERARRPRAAPLSGGT